MRPIAILRMRQEVTGGGGFEGFDNAEAEAYVTAMSVEPDDTRKALIDTLVGDLKADGIWAKLDWLCLLAAHDSQAALLNAINPAQSAAEAGSPTFTTDRGYTGNGSSSYLDVGEAWDAAGNNFTQDSCCLGAWCNLSGAGTAASPHIGNLTASRAHISARAAGSETFQAKDVTNDVLRASNGSKLGHRTASRTGAAIKRGFVNGSRVADLTTASASTALGNGTILRNVASYSNDRMAAIYSGGGLSDTEVGNMHTRLNTYLTAIGGN